MKRTPLIIIIVIVTLGLLAALLFFHKNTDKAGDRDVTAPSISPKIKDNLPQGDLLSSREEYKKSLEKTKNPNKIQEIQKKIEEINIKILFSEVQEECSAMYVVKPKDALIKIAQKFKTTVNLIKRANNLTSDVIRPNQKLKIHTCPFSIIVDKSQNILFLKRGNEIIKTYIVSTGKDNSTPVGKFKVVNKLLNPTWFRTGAVIPPDSPENILGTRWLGIDLKGYGIHGTTEPEKLGEQVTLGCVRMANTDVEELYDIFPVGTDVMIVD